VSQFCILTNFSSLIPAIFQVTVDSLLKNSYSYHSSLTIGITSVDPGPKIFPPGFSDLSVSERKIPRDTSSAAFDVDNSHPFARAPGGAGRGGRYFGGGAGGGASASGC
jgi:hypothetical protein